MTENKKCFVIMPISDQDGYEKGHFKRVYEHLIKPACELAGFTPIRADEESKTNYIVIDILKKILESEFVLCDLSAKNPNVFYELGIRQAFNKKVALIKDFKTGRVFDIQGLRAIDYDESLRIDSVQAKIKEIANTIKETYENEEEGNVNSLIQLLSIKPAKLNESFVISEESGLILKAINDIQNRISNVESRNSNFLGNASDFTIDGKEFKIGWSIYSNNVDIGNLVSVEKDRIIIKNKKNEIIIISHDNPIFSDLECLPF